MNDDNRNARQGTLAANIHVHGHLANTGEYQKSVHFRPENQRKVRAILQRLASAHPDAKSGRIVDFGCGTGFVIDLVHDLFAEVYGVDITQDMMKHVDRHDGTVRLVECLAEQTPFPDNHFEFATAYSFMDHLFSYQEFLAEVYRVLKPGGVFYSDLNPNRAFILNMERVAHSGELELNPIVQREIQGALHNGSHYAANYGLNATVLEDAEPIKTRDKGFDAHEVLQAGRDLGFSSCRVEYEWFLGQAKVMHGASPEDAEIIDQYLKMVLPVSDSLYKYLRFVFKK